MMETRRVSPCGCVKFVPCVRDLAEEFQGGGVRGSKGGECRCKELVAGGFYSRIRLTKVLMLLSTSQVHCPHYMLLHV